MKRDGQAAAGSGAAPGGGAGSGSAGIGWASAAMIGSAACWGSATVMSRDLLDDLTPLALLVVQLVASVIVLAFLALPERPWRHWGQPLRRASLAGLLEPGATYALGLAGLALTTVGNASVISATEPLIIVALAWLLLRQRPSRRLLIGVGIAVGGLLLLSMESLAGWGEGAHALGDLLVFVSTGFAAFYVIVAARYSALVPPATMAVSQQIIGLVFVTGLLLASELSGWSRQDLGSISAGLLAYAAASGVVQYGLAFWLYLLGLRRLPASSAGMWLALTPVFGILGAFLVLGEVPTGLMLLGAAFVIGALVYAGRAAR